MMSGVWACGLRVQDANGEAVGVRPPCAAVALLDISGLGTEGYDRTGCSLKRTVQMHLGLIGKCANAR